MSQAAGKRNQRVQFLESVADDDGLAVSETWHTVGTPRWAQVRRVSGNEEQGGGQVQATELLMFTLLRDRLTATITPANRIRFRGQDHVIVGSADDFDQNATISFTASVRADQ